MKNLLFFDIDGTLAIGKKVPESTKKALKIVREKGDLVFICTGRALSYVELFFSDYADGFVCSNGRFGIMGDKVLYNCPLTREQIISFTHTLRELDAGFMFFDERAGYYEGPDEQFDACAAVWMPGFLRKGLDEHKITAYNFDVLYKDKDHLKKIMSALGNTCLFNDHEPHPSADVTIKGADKGTAIKHIAQALNVSLDHVYAFGDGYNDIVMMEAAGHGVAMGNAVDPLKEKAEYITTDIHHDGIYNALKHYKLI